MVLWISACAALLLTGLSAAADEQPGYTRERDVIYGRRYGLALTMDVLRPASPNGAGVICVISGGWFSSHEAISPEILRPFLSRGFTVFAVVHGSQPRFTIPEAIEDVRRSVRFVRANAAAYGVDPERLGITGASAGGHLALTVALSAAPGDPAAKDPVERLPSRVAAVAALFPPTDFLNYGREGRDVFQALSEELKPFMAPFEFVRTDPASGRLIPVTDPQQRLEIARQISPVAHVSAGDPPVLLIHGDRDELVPLQQSKRLEEALRASGVPVELIVREGKGHGWEGLDRDVTLMADYFQRHLVAGKAEKDGAPSS